MRRRSGRRLGFLLCLWLGLAWACAAVAQPPPDSHEEVLVLLRQSPAHYRPNSDYGGGYGDDLSRSSRKRLADQIARNHSLTIVDDWPMPLLGLDCFIMSVPAGQSAEKVAALVSKDRNVAWSQPMHVYRAKGSAPAYSDPLFRAQPAAHVWRLADLHQLATGRGVVVAVIDSMVESDHPDLIGQVISREDFVAARPSAAERHGTGVAGIIAAKADNGLGIVGVAPHARLMALRACWQVTEAGAIDTVCNRLTLAIALHFAIDQKAQVINLSLSGPPDPLLSKLLTIALDRGSTVAAAFDRDLPHGGFPASQPGAIAVSDESLAALAPGVYIAPGRDVPTTQPGGRWSLVNGSSYAAAHVSGLLALLREHRRTAEGSLSLVSARPGGGVIDACGTLLRPSKPCDCTCAFARGEQSIARP